MQPIPLEYHSPQARQVGWRPVQCVLLFGPLTGAVVGLMEAAGGILGWAMKGKLRYFSSSWSDTLAEIVVFSIGAGIVGMAYGVILSLFEYLARRRVRMVIAIPVVGLVAFVVTGVIAGWSSREPGVAMFLILELIAITFSAVISILISRPAA